jgi:hypothetical protein
MEPLLNNRLGWSRKAFEFVKSIGLPITVASAEAVAKAFTPHILIRDGEMLVDLDNVFPGDILHEAAHVAITPPKFRALCNGGLKAVFKAMRDFAMENPTGLHTYPENALVRAIMQCDEQEAIAWQYAAAREIELPDEWLFPEGSFEGHGDDHLIRLKLSSHYGINGLQAAKWTVIRKNPHIDLPVYPKLAFWLSTAGEQ